MSTEGLLCARCFVHVISVDFYSGPLMQVHNYISCRDEESEVQRG